MSYVKKIEEILERIEYEKKYSEKVLLDGMKRLQSYNDEGAWTNALRVSALSEERLNTLKWVLDEVNLDHVDV
jgi:hypothetical protein